MRIYTVTHNGRAAALVRAASADEAIEQAQLLAEEAGLGRALSLRGLAAREPNDAEMVDWLEERQDHLLSSAMPILSTAS